MRYECIAHTHKFNGKNSNMYLILDTQNRMTDGRPSLVCGTKSEEYAHEVCVALNFVDCIENPASLCVLFKEGVVDE